MTTQEFEDAKTLWKMFYASNSFEYVQNTCHFISQQKLNPDDSIYYSLITSIYVLYGRPFRKSYGIGKLDEKIIPPEHIDAHNGLLEMRDQIYAHTDASGITLDQYGSVHQLRWTVKNSYAQMFATQLRTRPIVLDEVVELCKKLREKTDYYVEKLIERYRSLIPNADGEYVLNITDEKKAFLLKAIPFY